MIDPNQSPEEYRQVRMEELRQHLEMRLDTIVGRGYMRQPADAGSDGWHRPQVDHAEYYAGWAAYDTAIERSTIPQQKAQRSAEIAELDRMLNL